MSLVSFSQSSLAPGAGAAICRRGHVVRAFLEEPRVQGSRCDDCGAKVLVACEACGYRIRGAASAIARDYHRPDFCDGCGTVFSWTGRRQRIHHVMNLVDDEPIDPATKLEVQELLESLVDREVAEQGPVWLRILQIAPELWNGAGRSTLAGLVPVDVKARLGLRA